MRIRRRPGYTLVEMLVVMVLLAVAAAVVAPSLMFRREDSLSFSKLVATGRQAAIRRAEVLRLHIERSGDWELTEDSSSGEILMRGRLSNTWGSADLLFSPLGTCGPSPEDLPSPALSQLDQLNCEISP